eukprot:5908989-Prymnesium_polylepis.1
MRLLPGAAHFPVRVRRPVAQRDQEARQGAAADRALIARRFRACRTARHGGLVASAALMWRIAAIAAALAFELVRILACARVCACARERESVCVRERRDVRDYVCANGGDGQPWTIWLRMLLVDDE